MRDSQVRTGSSAVGISGVGRRCGARRKDAQKRLDFTSSQSRSTPERDLLNAGSFEIVVKGRLSPTLIAAVDGFEVRRCDLGLTHLVGWVPDQARLHSVLEVLRDLNIELVSVNPIPLSGLRTDEVARSSTTKGETDA